MKSIPLQTLRILALGVGALLVPGCISYALHRLPPAAELPPAPELRPSLVCSVRTYPATGQAGESSGQTFTNLSQLELEILAAFAASGRFRSVEAVLPDRHGDLQLDIVMSVDGNEAIILAGGMLLFIVPTWRTVTFDLTAEVKEPSGRWKRYHLVDQARDIHWLPMLVVMSVLPWGDAYTDVRANLYRTLLGQLHADGFLATPASAAVPRR